MSATTTAGAVMPAITKLSPRVVRIMGFNPSPMTLQGSNTYLVGTGTQRLLIDSGEGKPQYVNALQEALTTEAKSIGKAVEVSHLLLTHWHGDHVGGTKSVHHLFPNATILKKPSKYEPIAEDALCVEPPKELHLEGATLKVLPTPGHTDDHLCLFLKEEQAMFTSDTILGTGTSVFACYTEFMHSLGVLKSYKPRLLYPAHGPVVTDGVARIDEIIAHRQKRESQILESLDKSGKGMSIMDLVRDIYAATTPPNLWSAAGVNVFHQLKKLINEGKVVVVSQPALEPNILSEASDYAMLGEGVKTDPKIMTTVLNELIVAKPAKS